MSLPIPIQLRFTNMFNSSSSLDFFSSPFEVVCCNEVPGLLNPTCQQNEMLVQFIAFSWQLHKLEREIRCYRSPLHSEVQGRVGLVMVFACRKTYIAPPFVMQAAFLKLMNSTLVLKNSPQLVFPFTNPVLNAKSLQYTYCFSTVGLSLRIITLL